jgi:drug/metabolite transporter (DMT)-like permease
MSSPASPRPPLWALVLGFAVIYLSWGTTYFAIRKGVEHLPPALFGGTRIALAGLLLLGLLRFRGVPLRLTGRDFLLTALIGCVFFVLGNGLITAGQKHVPSGVAAVLVATTPLWIALAERFWPRGERLRLLGWLGLLVGLAGVVLLLVPRIQDPLALFHDDGAILILGSSAAWAVGSVVLRHHRITGSSLTSAAFQMAIGGTALTVIGLAAGEAGQLRPEQLNATSGLAFLYLLVVGSLVGFVTFNWLLGHVSAALVGTYSYVNPLVAILVGWLLGGEEVTSWTLAGMVVILGGVALVRGAGMPVSGSTPGGEEDRCLEIERPGTPDTSLEPCCSRSEGS